MTDLVQIATGPTLADLRRTRDDARTSLVELCLDTVRDLDVAAALADRRTPVIVSCRPSWEGGRFSGSEEERFRILNKSIELGAEYIDVEWRADRSRLVPRSRTKLVLSHQDLNGLPSDLGERVRAMRAEPADVVRMTVLAERLGDCLSLRDATTNPSGPQSVTAVGREGQITRICPWLFESSWTFAGAADAGHVSADDLIDVYRTPAGSRSTALYGIVGSPIGHSASPAMHNKGFSTLGLDALYLGLQTADADEALAVLNRFGFSGVSVTVPLKIALAARVDDMDEVGRRIGAINTLRRTPAGAWEGRNADVVGFMDPLVRRELALKGARAVVLGAGGAARAAVWALTREGADVQISARNAEKAERLAAELGVRATSWPPAPGWDLLVNATPVGMWPKHDAAPLGRNDVHGRCVYDLVYNPLETQLLAVAREHGAEAIDGLEMLVGQAVNQFEWWTGTPAPRSLFRAAAGDFVARTTAALSKAHA